MSKELIIFLLHKIWEHRGHMENKMISWHDTTEIHPGEINKKDEIN